MAWVGDDGQGAFSAWVDHDDPGPFSYLHGPQAASLAQALSWARRQAPTVILRRGDSFYSAGKKRAKGKPVWPFDDAVSSAPAQSAAPLSRWRVDGGMGWFRPDREAVAAALAEAVDRDTRASHVSTALRVPGFSVRFTLSARSTLEANAAASAVLRDAWDALGISAEPGADFDATHISVKPA